MTDEMKANYETLLDALTNEMQALHKELQECKEKLSQEPCEDVVSRSAVIDTLTKTSGIRGDALKALYDLPSVTPQPEMGRWKRINKEKYVQHAMSYYRCSECGEEIIGEHNYCPNCGTKMENEI